MQHHVHTAQPDRRVLQPDGLMSWAVQVGCGSDIIFLREAGS